MPRSPQSLQGYTLIEVMVVVAILGIVLTMGFPHMVNMLKKDPLGQASSDLVEALGVARGQAILRGEPWQFVFRVVTENEGGFEFLVVPILDPVSPEPGVEGEAPPSLPGFPKRVSPEVEIPLRELNFYSQMDQAAFAVRFFPNGTCDDLTIVLNTDRGRRKVMLDPTTGLAELEAVR